MTGVFSYIRILILALVCLCPRAFAPPLDLGRFLEEWELRPIIEGTTLYFNPGEPWENYVARDRLGNRYQLYVPPESQQTVENLALTQVAAILGLPCTPSYPTMVRRGQGGILPVHLARQVFGQRPLAVTQTELGNWLSAYVSPYIDINVHRLATRDGHLTAKQLADYTNYFIFRYVFGIRLANTPHVTRDSVVMGGWTNVFQWYDTRDKPEGSFRGFTRHMNTAIRDFFPVARLRALAAREGYSEADMAVYWTTVGHFLSRLEALASMRDNEVTLLERLIRPAIDRRRFPQQERLVRLIKANIEGVRAEVVAALGGIDARFSRSAPEAQTMRLTPYYVDFSRYQLAYRAKTPELGAGWEFRAKDYLLMYTFASYDMKLQLMKDWAKALDTRDPLFMIWERATVYDNRVLLAAPSRYSRHLQELDTGAPWFLNTSMRHALVVVGRNDSESLRIRAIAEHIGRLINSDAQKYVTLYDGLPDYRSGVSITERDFLDAIARARAIGAEVIILCELGEVTERMREAARQANINILHLDHHLALVNKLSTLELFANVFNYPLSLADFVTAIIDRSGVGGLKALGFTKDDLRDYLRATNQLERVERIVEQFEGRLMDAETLRADPNRLLRFYRANGRLSSITLPLAYLYFPDQPHILIRGDRHVRFIGPYAVTIQLRTRLEGQLPPGQWRGGGDMNSGYVIYMPHGYPDMVGVTNQFEATLRTIHAYRCTELLESAAF